MLCDQIFPVIEGLATATPPNKVLQSKAAQFVVNLPLLKCNRNRIEKLYLNTRIDTRFLAIDLANPDTHNFHNESPPIQNRMKLYREYGIPLVEEATRKVLKHSALGNEFQDALDQKLIDSIGSIIIVSSTGFLAPGLDTEIIKKFNLRRNIARTNISFMGCAAAMNGLRVACDYVRTHPHQKVLLICVELSSVNAVFEDEMNDIIIHSIFGDGCAAVLIGACQTSEAITLGYTIIEDHFSHLVANTEDGIILDVQDNGITCKLSRQLPQYLADNVGDCIEGFLKSHELNKDDIDLWAVHPGGTKIIQNVQLSLGLRDEQVVDSWEILRQYGNMLSPAVLFVMERMLNKVENSQQISKKINQKKEILSQYLTGIAFSFAPGVGVEGILFRQPLKRDKLNILGDK